MRILYKILRNQDNTASMQLCNHHNMMMPFLFIVSPLSFWSDVAFGFSIWALQQEQHCNSHNWKPFFNFAVMNVLCQSWQLNIKSWEYNLSSVVTSIIRQKFRIYVVWYFVSYFIINVTYTLLLSNKPQTLKHLL